ncbi:MAG: hypothetical protein AB2787_03650 [Candidatus Thiodiazotropha endolucinida]
MTQFHYLDANCLVKLVVDEIGSNELREHCSKQGIIFATTNFCFYEALGVLKTKWIKKNRPDCISEESYLMACEDLCARVEDEQIKIEEIAIHNRQLFNDSEKLTKKYRIDLSDAFQLVSIKKGMLARLKTPINPNLISEDEGIYRAAKGEGLQVLKINELIHA